MAQSVETEDIQNFEETITYEEIKPIETSSKIRNIMATSSISLDTAYTLVAQKDSNREITARLDILISLNREILKALK